VSSISKDLQLARLHGRAELIEQSRGEPRRLGLVRRILQIAWAIFTALLAPTFSMTVPTMISTLSCLA
jgi:hypothetical protein